MRRLETLELWPDLLELKDEMSLRELAARFEVTPGAISAALKRGGVTRVPAPPGPRSARRRPQRDGRGLANFTDVHLRAISEDGSPNPRPGSKDPAIYAYFDQLGDVPDADVARSAGVSVRTIASFRARHDIMGYKGPRRPSTTGRRKRSKIDPFVSLLGQVPDRVIAEKASVSLNAVRNYRVKRGIQASGRRGRPSGRTRQPQPNQFQEGARHAWRIVAGNSDERIEGIVIAENLREASANATEGLNGAVVTRIEWVGALL